MKQREFVELSKKKVEALNLGNSDAEEAWRDGYLYAISKIEEIFAKKDNDEACFLIEEMITDTAFLDQFE
jgi:hypothetical protein